MKVWKAFARSKGLRITCFALAGALLVASIVGLWYSSAAPTEEVPTAKYEHSGQFDYTVYLKPNTLYGDVILTEEEEEEEEATLVFFRNIIEKTRLAFSYQFDSSEPVASIINDVVVSIIAENPDVWQKEMTRLEETHKRRDFRVDFPLNLGYLDSVVDDIEEEIGITSSQRNFVIKAVVHTTAETSSGEIIEDDFSHEITAILKAKSLELEGALEDSEAGSKEGITYKEKGWFDYEVYLKPNELYGPIVLRSERLPEAEPPASPQTLGPGLLYYFPKIIDTIEASFSYQLSCNRPISEQSEEVEVTAIIENPDKWSKILVVVPGTRKEGSFTISFPIDIQYFTKVINAIENETDVHGSSYNIKIKTDVRTTAETDLGRIDEVYTQILGVKREENTLTFDEELSQSQSGTISGATIPGGSEREALKMPSLAGLIVALVALGFLGWNQAQLKLVGITAGEAEVARARKKYGQVIVDIEELPEAKPNDTIIPLSSLEDLVRIADDLVKPILHHAEKGRHSYCIIDSGVRYLYTVET